MRLRGKQQIPFGNDRKKSKGKSKGKQQIPYGNDNQESKDKPAHYRAAAVLA